MNAVFYAILVLAFLGAAAFGTPAEVGKAALDSSKTAVNLAIGLVGYMSLVFVLMKIVEESGGLAWMARTIRPLLVRIFPDVPADHPAMGAMVMNIAANALGLGNAATPFGLKAMKELKTLQNWGYGNLAVCMAKTQYSFSHEMNELGAPSGFTLPIRELRLNAGAGFIVAICGTMMTMPGLPRIPAGENMDMDEDGNLLGMFG